MHGQTTLIFPKYVLQKRSVFFHVDQTMQYTVTFLLFALQLSVKLIEISKEKETIFGWSSVVEMLVREELKDI